MRWLQNQMIPASASDLTKPMFLAAQRVVGYMLQKKRCKIENGLKQLKTSQMNFLNEIFVKFDRFQLLQATFQKPRFLASHRGVGYIKKKKKAKSTMVSTNWKPHKRIIFMKLSQNQIILSFCRRPWENACFQPPREGQATC